MHLCHLTSGKELRQLKSLKKEAAHLKKNTLYRSLNCRSEKAETPNLDLAYSEEIAERKKMAEKESPSDMFQLKREKAPSD